MGCNNSRSRELTFDNSLLQFKDAKVLTCKGKIFQGFISQSEDIYDGDTLKLIHYGDFIDSNPVKTICRIIGIDAPEVKKLSSRVQGLESRDFLRNLLPINTLFQVMGYGEDKYGRYLIDIILPDQRSLQQVLLENHKAIPYNGGTKKPYDPNDFK